MAMISDDFLDLLRCPLNHGRLLNAEPSLVERLNEAIAAGDVRNRAGDAVTEKLDGGLVDEGKTLVYAVRDGIPCLLVDESIMLDQFEQRGPHTETN